MKPSRFLFLLTLIGLFALRKTRGDQNEKERRLDTPDPTYNRPPNDSGNSSSFVYTVAIQPSPEDYQWHEDEKKYWEKQIYTAQIMNVITFIAGVVGIGGLIVLGFTLHATQQAADAAKEQATAAKDAVKLTRQSIEHTILALTKEHGLQ